MGSSLPGEGRLFDFNSERERETEREKEGKTDIEKETVREKVRKCVEIE